MTTIKNMSTLKGELLAEWEAMTVPKRQWIASSRLGMRYEDEMKVFKVSQGLAHQ